jgi:hypothetical protein
LLPRIKLIRELASYPNRIPIGVIRVLKCPSREPTASDLTVRERILLFCIASRTDLQKVGVPGETVIDMIEKGLIVDHPFDRLALTMRSRAAAAGTARNPQNKKIANVYWWPKWGRALEG